ncbi:hypothetical protein Tco_0550324 [Tanacetum coccineum]
MKTQDLVLEYVETASGSAATPSEVNNDDVTTTCDTVIVTDSKEAYRRFGGLLTSGFVATPSDPIFYIYKPYFSYFREEKRSFILSIVWRNIFVASHMRSSLIEKPDGARGVVGGESRGVEGEDLGILMIKIWLENGDGEAMEKKDGVFAEVDGTFIVTEDRDIVKFYVIIYDGLFHPQCLLACLAYGYVFGFCGGMARAVCLLENDKCMDKSKITRKQSKNGQARTRESEEYKAEAKNVKPQSKPNPKPTFHS